MKASGPCGTIKPGGDKHGYLEHFRQPAVLKRGHNLGPPGTGVPPAGGGGLGPAVGATPVREPGGLQTPPTAVQSPVAGAVPQRPAGVPQTPAGGAPTTPQRQAVGNQLLNLASGMPTPKGGGRPRRPKMASAGPMPERPSTGARMNLANAVAGARKARQGVRTSMRGGKKGGLYL